MLSALSMQGNSMTGEIPDSLYNMKKLEMLRLDDTLMAEDPWLAVSDEGFTGSISTLIGDLKKLRMLLITNNPISGTM